MAGEQQVMLHRTKKLRDRLFKKKNGQKPSLPYTGLIAKPYLSVEMNE